MKQPYLAKLRFLLFLLISLASWRTALAQTGNSTVNGRVTDTKNQGIPGVTVLVEGTTLGTSTNVDGTFTITNVPAGGHTLVISFVGYAAVRQEIAVETGKATTVPVQQLTETNTQLGEAIVVGYGSQRRQDVTGAIEQITEKQFVKGQVTNPEQLIQGKVAGVQITTAGGAPGSSSSILIRGGSSLTASNAPLIIIDGVPVDNTGIAGASNPLSLINPNDIESITVLKDASSTAIYGVRASNGVILVTTKKGIIGDKVHVTASTLHSVAKIAKYADVLSADEFRSLVNTYGTTGQKAVLGTASTNWQREIYRPAYSADNNVSVGGAVGNLPYRASVGYLSQQGILKKNDLSRYTGSLSLTPVLLDGKLRVVLNVKGSWIDNNFSSQDAIGGSTNFDPTQPITFNEAKYAPYGGFYESLDPSGSGSLNTLAIRNPVSVLTQRRDRSTVKRSIGNITLDYKLPFVPGLSANLNIGYDVQRSNGTIYVPVTSSADFFRQGRNNHYKQDLNNSLLEAYGKYERTLGPGRLELLAGYSYQKFENRSYVFSDYRASGEVFSPVSRSYSGDTTYLNTNVLVGFYGRLNYNIADKYLFTGTFRADGTSRFPVHFGYFPSGAFAWRLKGEEFLKNSSAISDLKLRLGFGQTGQQDLGSNYYPFLANLSLSTLTAQYQQGYNADGTPRFVRTLRPDQYNPDIQWETTTTYNIGLDYGFFGGRLFGSVDVYQRDTKDLLNDVNIADLSGLSNHGVRNVGSLTNKGIEAVVNLEVVKGEKFNLTLNTNATYNRNRLTKLTYADSPNDVGQLTGVIAGGVGNNIQVNTVGYATQAFYVYQQAYDNNGKPLEGVYVDRNGDGVITSADRYRYKSPRPEWTLGGGANASYGGFNLAFTLRASLGNYVYNNVRSGSFFDTSTNGYLVNRNREVLSSGFTSAQYFSDYFVENASFLRMQNATLGYNFGELLKKGTNVNLSFAVQNVFVVSNYKGIDPEVNGGIDNSIYPRPRTFTVGLNVGF